MDRQAHWLNKSEMAASLGISVQAFDRWGVTPVARIGREAFFDVRSVLDNRLAQASRKYAPSGEAEGEEGLDPLAEKKLLQEKLRLTAELADTQAIKNEVKRRTLVPVDFALFAFSRIAAQIGSVLDTIPLQLRRRNPDLDARHVEAMQREIALARNLAAGLGDQLPDLVNEYFETLDE